VTRDEERVSGARRLNSDEFMHADIKVGRL